MKLTSAEENYILAIHRLSDGELVSTNELAHEIGIAPASVTDMIQKLAEKEFVRYEKYKGVKLLPIGLKIAEQLSESNSVWHAFLSDELGLTSSEIAPLMNQLKHVQSKLLIERLTAFLQQHRRQVVHPQNVESHMPPQQKTLFDKPSLISHEKTALRTLDQCKVGESVIITGLTTVIKDGEQLFAYLQLPLGGLVVVKNYFTIDHSFLIECGGKEQLVSTTIASIIQVA